MDKTTLKQKLRDILTQLSESAKNDQQPTKAETLRAAANLQEIGEFFEGCNPEDEQNLGLFVDEKDAAEILEGIDPRVISTVLTGGVVVLMGLAET